MRTRIVMPAYKAAGTLEKTYREIPSRCADEVLVVDDASPDPYRCRGREFGHTGPASS